ncbi:MAG: helix-turn-helix domain-containing protein [Chloroflexi bacterium]|nr:helix-turn-helix domain-containing protein [Chloroflexota bacterium]
MAQGEHVSFGVLLRRYRVAAGMSREALADRAGLSRRGMADLERGAHQFPFADTVRRLADALALDPSERAAMLAAARRPTLASSQRLAGLPLRRTELIGREVDLQRLQELVLTTPGRLVTLTGSGGCGKTSLGLELARRLVDRFPDGAWLVDLTPLADPLLVSQAVASTLGVREGPDRPLLDAVVAYLGPKYSLLVLDNCEHLVAACAGLVERLLSTCANLHILATSREPLRIQGETTWRVPSLTFPDPHRLPPLAELSELSAVRLFADRARAVESSFALHAQNAGAVAQICWHLDGMPLALELAAARVQAISVDKLADRLGAGFRLLGGGSRTAPSRQQTLEATLDWSYGLLDPSEQAVLRYLAVFAGGFELEAAELVCDDASTSSRDVLDILTQLVAKSLVQVERHPAGARYRLLETVRQHALERLRARGEAEAARARHFGYYAMLAQRTTEALWGQRLLGPFGRPEQLAHLAELEGEHDNLRVALNWTGEHGDVADFARLGIALWAFWFVQGYIAEGWRWAEVCLAHQSELAPELRAQLLGVASCLAVWRGDNARVGQLCAQALPLFRAQRDDWNVGLVLTVAGLALGFAGDFQAARLQLEESLAVYRGLDDAFGIGLALLDLGEVLWFSGDRAGARRILLEALAPLRRAGDVYQLVEALVNVGGIELELAAVEAAAELTSEALMLLRDSRLQFFLPEALELAAELAAARHEAELAAQLFGAAELARERTGAVRYATADAGYLYARKAVRSALPAAVFAEVWAEGRALAPQGALELALATVRRTAPAADAARGEPLANLTPREREVAFLIADGLTNRQIADALVIAEGTAAVHVNHILVKLGCTSRARVAALVGRVR